MSRSGTALAGRARRRVRRAGLVARHVRANAVAAAAQRYRAGVETGRRPRWAGAAAAAFVWAQQVRRAPRPPRSADAAANAAATDTNGVPRVALTELDFRLTDLVLGWAVTCGDQLRLTSALDVVRVTGAAGPDGECRAVIDLGHLARLCDSSGADTTRWLATVDGVLLGIDDGAGLAPVSSPERQTVLPVSGAAGRVGLEWTPAAHLVVTVSR